MKLLKNSMKELCVVHLVRAQNGIETFISSRVMRGLKCPTIRNKMDAYRFESGKNGLTKQILRKGKKVIVVGRNGIGYEKEAWNVSKTFRQSGQENLMVADNQTRDYQGGSPERRGYLSTITWGETIKEGCNG